MQIVRKLEKVESCYSDLRRKYGINGGATLTKWVRKYRNGSLGNVIRAEQPEEIDEKEQLKRRVRASGNQGYRRVKKRRMDSRPHSRSAREWTEGGERARRVLEAGDESTELLCAAQKARLQWALAQSPTVPNSRFAEVTNLNQNLTWARMRISLQQ